MKCCRTIIIQFTSATKISKRDDSSHEHSVDIFHCLFFQDYFDYNELNLTSNNISATPGIDIVHFKKERDLSFWDHGDGLSSCGYHRNDQNDVKRKESVGYFLVYWSIGGVIDEISRNQGI